MANGTPADMAKNSLVTPLDTYNTQTKQFEPVTGPLTEAEQQTYLSEWLLRTENQGMSAAEKASFSVYRRDDGRWEIYVKLASARDVTLYETEKEANAAIADYMAEGGHTGVDQWVAYRSDRPEDEGAFRIKANPDLVDRVDPKNPFAQDPIDLGNGQSMYILSNGQTFTAPTGVQGWDGWDAEDSVRTIGNRTFAMLPDGTTVDVSEDKVYGPEDITIVDNFEMEDGSVVSIFSDGTKMSTAPGKPPTEAKIGESGYWEVRDANGNLSLKKPLYQAGIDYTQAGFNILYNPEGQGVDLGLPETPSTIETIGGQQFIRGTRGELEGLDGSLDRAIDYAIISGQPEKARAWSDFQNRPDSLTVLEKAMEWARTPGDQQMISKLHYMSSAEAAAAGEGALGLGAGRFGEVAAPPQFAQDAYQTFRDSITGGSMPSAEDFQAAIAMENEPPAPTVREQLEEQLLRAQLAEVEAGTIRKDAESEAKNAKTSLEAEAILTAAESKARILEAESNDKIERLNRELDFKTGETPNLPLADGTVTSTTDTSGADTSTTDTSTTDTSGAAPMIDKTVWDPATGGWKTINGTEEHIADLIAQGIYSETKPATDVAPPGTTMMWDPARSPKTGEMYPVADNMISRLLNQANPWFLEPPDDAYITIWKDGRSQRILSAQFSDTMKNSGWSLTAEKAVIPDVPAGGTTVYDPAVHGADYDMSGSISAAESARWARDANNPDNAPDEPPDPGDPDPVIEADPDPLPLASGIETRGGITYVPKGEFAEGSIAGTGTMADRLADSRRKANKMDTASSIYDPDTGVDTNPFNESKWWHKSPSGSAEVAERTAAAALANIETNPEPQLDIGNTGSRTYIPTSSGIHQGAGSAAPSGRSFSDIIPFWDPSPVGEGSVTSSIQAPSVSSGASSDHDPLSGFKETFGRAIPAIADFFSPSRSAVSQKQGVTSPSAWEMEQYDPDWMASGGQTRDRMAMVGESGPELALFPNGTEIIPLDRNVKPDQRRRLRRRGIRGMQAGGLVFDPSPGISQFLGGREVGPSQGRLFRKAGFTTPSAQALRNILPEELEEFRRMGAEARIPEGTFERELAQGIASGTRRSNSARFLPLSLRS